LPPQHSWPDAPHAAHVPIAQVAPEAVQVVPAIGGPPSPAPAPPPQHACPTAPQLAPAAFWHEPLLHVPAVPLPPMQAEPLPRHCPATQQPPALHAFAAQHGCPAAPHARPPGPTVAAPLPPPQATADSDAATVSHATSGNHARRVVSFFLPSQANPSTLMPS
jgi:hypothetical protein